jgi:hypothetical protein
MNRISITFYEEVFSKLQKYADEKKISIAQFVREMVDIGLRVQEISNKNDQENKKDMVLEKLDEMQKLIKNNMISGYENLYLTRYSVLNLPEKSEEELDGVIEKAKIKSKAYIEGLSDKN